MKSGNLYVKQRKRNLKEFNKALALRFENLYSYFLSGQNETTDWTGSCNNCQNKLEINACIR